MALASALACSATTAPAPPAAPAAPAVALGSPAYERALATAREAGRSSNALVGPRLRMPATQADGDQATKDWGKWLDARSAGVNLAKRAYGDAAKEATPLQKAQLRREISEVLLAFFDDTAASYESVTAPSARTAIARETLRRALLGKLLPILENVHQDLTDCVRVAGEGGDAAESRRCAALLPRVDAVFAEADAYVAADEWRYLRVAKGDHPTPAPSRTSGCELGGNADLGSANVFPTADAKTASFYVMEADVSRLAPAATRTGRLPIRIAWPIVAEGWIDHSELPFNLGARVDIVKGKLWLGEGARVSAFGPRGGKVTIVRPGARAGEPRPEPDGAEVEMACDVLRLGPDRWVETPEKGTPGAIAGTVPLYEAPNGKKIATLHFPTNMFDQPFIVRVLEERVGFTRVLKWSSHNTLGAQPYVPFDFDAWVKGPVPEEKPWGMLVGRDDPASPTHRATAAAGLRGEPSASAPVIARLAQDAPFVTGKAANGFVAIKLPGIGRRADLWLAQVELASAATALPKPANARPAQSARDKRRRLSDIPVSTYPAR
jgi:hypothetical protein